MYPPIKKHKKQPQPEKHTIKPPRQLVRPFHQTEARSRGSLKPSTQRQNDRNWQKLPARRAGPARRKGERDRVRPGRRRPRARCCPLAFSARRRRRTPRPRAAPTAPGPGARPRPRPPLRPRVPAAPAAVSAPTAAPALPAAAPHAAGPRARFLTPPPRSGAQALSRPRRLPCPTEHTQTLPRDPNSPPRAGVPRRRRCPRCHRGKMNHQRQGCGRRGGGRGKGES